MEEKELFLNTEDAIKNIAMKLKSEMNLYDRWASQNPQKLTHDNLEFKQIKQKIKLLNLQRKELIDMDYNFRNTVRLHYEEEESNEPTFTKSRNDRIVGNSIKPNKLGNKRGNKVSSV